MKTNDAVAERFLECFTKVVQEVQKPAPRTYQRPNEIVQLDDPNAPETVILSKLGVDGKKLFYAGVKPGGQPRWVVFEKYALPVSAHLVHLYEMKLEETLFPMWPEPHV